MKNISLCNQDSETGKRRYNLKNQHSFNFSNYHRYFHKRKRIRMASIRLLFLLLLTVSVTLLFAADHSFDVAKGVLSIDYNRYLSKHAIVFNSPITDNKSALTVGNGRVGAMVWNANGLTMQVTGVDA